MPTHGLRGFPLFVLFALTACGSSPRPETAATASFASLGIAHGSASLPGIYCSGQPTEAQFAGLRDAGVRRVVCLRPLGEPGTGWEEEQAARLGLDFVRLPVGGAEDIDEQHARKLDAKVSGVGGATLVCCGSSNRVGALLALRAHFVEGRSSEEALAIGKACGLTKLEPTVIEALGK